MAWSNSTKAQYASSVTEVVIHWDHYVLNHFQSEFPKKKSYEGVDLLCHSFSY